MLIVYCEICGEKVASTTCKVCMRSVCNEHVGRSGNTCRLCEETLCKICGENLSIGYCTFCGREVCEDCSERFDELRYVCVECKDKVFKKP